MNTGFRPAAWCCISFALLFFLLSSPLRARDIDLDAIYIRKTSPHLTRLLFEKLDAYQSVDSVFIDRDVIFAGWVSGYELFYIREVTALNQNILYLYHIDKRKSTEICRFPGVLTVARASPGGRFVAMKRLVLNEKAPPSGETLLCLLPHGELKTMRSSNGFLDFDLPAEGDSIVYESAGGFVEFFPFAGIERPVLARGLYSDIAGEANSCLAMFSPGRRSILVICGGGGTYSAKLLSGHRSTRLGGITSAGEVCWIDPSRLAFRSGFSGNYSFTILDVDSSRSAQVISGSMNTNLCASPAARKIALLKDQVIHIYGMETAAIINTGIEGEDVSFSPLGGRFSSLICKKLFVTNLHTVVKRHVELKRCWNRILKRYIEIKNDRSQFESEYSLDYIQRKIKIYSSMVNKP